MLSGNTTILMCLIGTGVTGGFAPVAVGIVRPRVACLQYIGRFRHQH
jgi:hypothetical protein